MNTLKNIVGAAFDFAVPRCTRERLGRYILRRARGEDNDVAEFNGEYALLGRYASTATSKSIIFDVGANKGDWTMHALNLFRHDTVFFAFEPVADTFMHLQLRLTTHPKGHLAQAAHLALGDHSGQAEINVSGELAGSNSLYRRQGAGVEGSRSEVVQVQRGDDFCAARNIREVGFLKIDTEGHEMAVLRGFSGMLASQSVRVVQFEYGGTWIDSRIYLQDAFKLLNAHGYSVGRVMPDRVEWHAKYRQELDSFRYSNWVAAVAGQEKFC